MSTPPTYRNQPLSADERLIGTVERVTFHSADSGFCVLRVKVKGQRDSTTVIGSCPKISAGEYIECQGQWVNDRKHGVQFKAQTLRASTPTTLEGMQKYLASGMIKGIGPHFAKKLIKAFGDQVFNVIEQQPERLTELPGIGKKRADSVVEAWQQQRSVRDIMLFLHSHGVGSARAVRIYKTYGDNAIDLIRENPYRLANDIYGIGFKTADALAQNMGIDPQALIRAQAGVIYSLQQWCQQGHCAAEYHALIELSCELLEISQPIIEQAIAKEIKQQRLVSEQINQTQFIYVSNLHQAEIDVAHYITELLQASPPWGHIDADKLIPWVEQKTAMQLAPSQHAAIKTVLQHKISIITGGPGVGKTTVVNSIINILKTKQLNITLCAPTGRAAKRLSETSQCEAKTIHRLLEYNPATHSFKHHQQHPLATDVLIVDEASMIDISLMSFLVKAIPRHAALLLVGDIDQLPAVGPGNVLADLIASNSIATACMSEIFRQAAHSKIIINAHRINQGQLPLDHHRNDDFFTLYQDNPEQIASQLITLVSQRLPKHYHCNPIDSIQVLTPMNRGALGSRALNVSLQQTLNPNASPSISRFGWTFAAKDKVIQNVNNYDKQVFNGDIGTIISIDTENTIITIRFEQRLVEYEFHELDEISLAYAISIHKSQGSEYPIVVIPISTQHYPLLARNLLYTGVTRGKKLVVLVGQKKAISIAVNNYKSKQRITQLSHRLQLNYREKHSNKIVQDEE